MGVCAQHGDGYGTAVPDPRGQAAPPPSPSAMPALRPRCVSLLIFSSLSLLTSRVLAGVIAHVEMQTIVGQVMDTFRDRLYGLSCASDEMPSPVVMKVLSRTLPRLQEQR